MHARSEILRRWGARAMVLVAALASIATSPLRWKLAAPPPTIVATAGHGEVLVVEASQEPTVSIERGVASRYAPRRGGAGAAWTTSGEFFVPFGWSVAKIEIMGSCGGGLCSSRCVPPPTAFVRVARVDVVDTWSLEDTLVTAVMFDVTRTAISLDVEVDSSAGVDLSADTMSSTPPGLKVAAYVFDYPGPGSSVRTYGVNLSAGATTLTTADIKLTATLHGICPGGACSPPVAAHVKIVDAKQH